MSYLPFRDNPDARIPNLALRDQLVALAEQIDLSSRTSAHEDSCGCKDGPKCTFRSWHENHEAATAEALAWMWNKGLLNLPSHLSQKPAVSEDQPKPRVWKTVNCLRWPVYVGREVVGGGDDLQLARSVAQQQSAERPGDFVTVSDPEGHIVVGYLDGAQLGAPLSEVLADSEQVRHG